MKKTVRLFLCMMLTASLLLGMCVSASAESEVTVIRTGERGASLRSSPESLENNKITGVHADVYLQVLDQRNGWYLVCYLGLYGWVYSGMVTVVPPGAYPGLAMNVSNVSRIVTGERGVSLRSSPEKTENNKICGVHANVILDVLDESNGWFLVCYRNQYGWVASNPDLVTIIGYKDGD